MRSFLIRSITSGLAIWVAAAIVPGVRLAEDTLGNRLFTLLLVAVIFGVINGLIKPIVQVLTMPLYVLTLGLFALVLNALLFWFTGWLAGALDLAFAVDGFWSALFGALVVSLVTMLLGAVIRD